VASIWLPVCEEEEEEEEEEGGGFIEEEEEEHVSLFGCWSMRM
jgi:hypothetical protein